MASLNLKDRLTALFDNSGFRGPVLKLLSGTGLTFVIGYLAKPVLTRLFPSDVFGIWGVIIAVVGVLAPLSTLRYDDALMLPREGRKAAHAFILSWLLLAGICMVLFLLIPFRTLVAPVVEWNTIAGWVWVIPLVLLVNRGAKITEVWLSRNEAFTRISAGQVIHTSTMTGVRLGAGFLQPVAGGYIGGFIAGYALTIASYAKPVWVSLRRALGTHPTLPELREIIVRYRRFPLFTMPAAVVSALVMRIPMIMIFGLFDSNVAGLFSEAFNNLLVPLSLVAAAVGQVYYVRAVQARRSGTLNQITDNVHRRLVLIGLFPVACLMITGPDVFDVVLGSTSNWRQAGTFILYIGPLVLLSTIASPLTRLFDVLERQRLEFATAAAMLIVLSGALWMAADEGDIGTFLTWLGVAGAIVRLFQLGIILRLARVSWTRILAPYVRYLGLSAPILALLYLATRTLSPLAVTLCTALAFGSFAIYALAFERLLAHRPDSDTQS